MIATLDAPPETGRVPARNLVPVSGTRIGQQMSERRFFNARDVARMWGEEKARQDGKDVAEAVPLSPETVRSYVRHSRPNEPGQKPHRYADNPAPLPTYLNEGQTHGPNQLRPMLWFPDEGETLAELERRLRTWWHSRVGPGVGGGRPPKQRERTAVDRAAEAQ